MKKHSLVILVVIILSIFSKTISGQSINILLNSIQTDTIHLCLNDWLNLNAKVSENILMNNNFNNQTLGSGLSSSLANPVFNNPCQCPFVGNLPPSSCSNGSPGQLGPDSAFAWVGTTISTQRSLITDTFNLIPYLYNNSCKISWWMMYGITDEYGACEDPDAPNEGVHLQYSINNGNSWFDFPGPNINPIGNLSPVPPFNTTVVGTGGYWGATSPTTTQMLSTLYFWNKYEVSIPSIAYTSSTKFRWAQLITSSNGYDSWGIDEVKITGTPAYTIQWACLEIPSWSSTNITPPPIKFTQTGTYHFTINCYDNYLGIYFKDTVVAIVNSIPVTNGIIGPTLLCNNQSNISYTSVASLNAESYHWTLPIGVYGASTNSSINVNFSTIAQSGAIKLKTHNYCGDGNTSMIYVTIDNCKGINQKLVDDISLYPNPLNNTATITYTLKVNQQLNIGIYDITGRKIKELYNSLQQKGDHKLVFDAADLSNGTYFLKTKGDDISTTLKFDVVH